MTKFPLVKLNFPLLPGAPGTFSAPMIVSLDFTRIFRRKPWFFFWPKTLFIFHGKKVGQTIQGTWPPLGFRQIKVSNEKKFSMLL